jgi:hypothetical protein
MVLGARNRERGPVLAFWYIAYLEKIEEVPGQDQLHRTLSRGQLVEEFLEFFGRLEPVAARVPPDVGVRDEYDERVFGQL